MDQVNAFYQLYESYNKYDCTSPTYIRNIQRICYHIMKTHTSLYSLFNHLHKGDTKMKPFQLPEDFLFGTATASLQIEGGDRNNNWYRFCEQQKTKDGAHCIEAADHWNRFKEDIDLMTQLHQDTYRMSLEWARIEPDLGCFDENALTHYRKIISTLLDKGIRPLVTLHHFSNPIWFEDMGGWANRDAVLWFDRFVRKVIFALG